MPWGSVFAQIIGDERSTKFASQCICMSPIHLNRKFVENFKLPSLKPLSQICSNFILSFLKSGEWKIAKMVVVHWPRWPPCPYMVKHFKNLLLQNWGCLGAESVHKSSGTGDLPKLLKRLSYVDIWPFYGKVKFASLCICMSPINLYGKIVENFRRLLLWSHWAKFAQIFSSPEQEVLTLSYCGQSLSVVCHGGAAFVMRLQQLL